MPIGGYKGSGLNVAIGLLTGVMSGTAFGGSVIDHRVELDSPTNTDQSIFVLRPDLIMSESESFESVDDHLDELRVAFPTSVVVRIDGQDLFWWGSRTPGAIIRLGEALCDVVGAS